MSEKLIFPIGFDLEEGVKKAGKDWKNHYRKRLQDAIDSRPLKVKIDFESKGIDTKEFKQWMALSREAEKLERERIKNAREWQKVADQQAMAETRRANATNESNARIERANRRAEASERRKRDAVERTNEAYKRQGGYLSRLFQRMVAYASVAQAFSFIRNIREVTAEFELQRVALGSIIGDMNEANKMFEQIKAAAVKSPFQIKELVTYTKQLAAYKIESDELFETTQRLADISAGLGVGMERLVLAYGQIRATGYLRASEVRQLTEAGIPIVAELAKKMSELRGETVSAAEVMGMISERAISFGMVKEVFDDMTSAGGMFYKMQEKQAETLAGQWSNLQDAIAIMYEEIGNTEGAQNGIKGMIGLIKSLAENWRAVGNVVKAIGVGTLVYVTMIKNATIASKALTVAEAKRNAVTSMQLYQMPKILSMFLTENAAKKVNIFLSKQMYAARLKEVTATNVLSKALAKLKIALLKNPYTALVAVLATVIGYFAIFKDRVVQADDAIKGINSSLSEFERHATATDDLMEKYNRLAGTTNRTAKEQKEYQETLNELGKMYPDAIEGMDKYGNVLDLNIERLAEASTLQREFNRDLAETQIQLAESLIPKLEEEIEDAKNALGKRFFSYWGNYSKEWKFGLFSGDKDQTELLDMIASMREEIEKLKKSADEARKKLAGITEEGDGKNLSDTFNTWQKELASITEGKNLKGEGIRIFDDESIAQTPKLTSALEKVAEKYKELKKEKAQVDKALASEGAKADKQTYAQLEERLGKINEGMSGLEAFLKKYGGLSLITEKGENKSQLAILQEEFQLHEKIYAKYKEYRKYMSAEQAKTKVEDYFGDTIKSLKYTPSFEKSGYQNVLTQYKTAVNALLAKAKNETEKGAIKKVLLELGFKIDDKDWEETKDNMEKNLKKLSDDLSRTKTAKEFFDRMLGMTGDRELSATLTMSVYGIEKPEGELSEFFAKQLADDMQKQIQKYLPNIDISSTINEATGEIDPVKLKGIVDALDPLKAGQTNIDAVKKLIDEMISGNAKYIESLYNSYEKFLDYEHRKTIVAEREAEERKKIAENATLDEDEKKKLTEASKKRERAEKLKIDIEQFKAGEEYVKIFEEIENLSTMSIGRLMGALDKFMKDNAAVLAENPEQLKTLMGEYQKLYEGLISRNPFRAIVDGLKEYQSATKNVISARKELKQAEDSGDEAKIASAKAKLADALDKQQKALNKQVNGYQAAASAISNFGSIITDITEILGIAEDSEAGAFIKDIVKWLGVMATVLSTVAAILVVINTVGAPFLAIAAGIAAIAAAISFFSNAKVREANKEIERQQELLDQLAYSYERLEKAQEKAFGSDYISNYEQRLANLVAQQDAYLKQAEAERSKGKKADSDKIKEYEKQAQDTADAIKDMQGEIAETLTGTDVASAARDFASAWIEAYKEFGSTTDAISKKFKDMIQNMIVESLAAKVMQTMLEPIFNEIDRLAQEGGEFSVQDASMIASMAATESGKMNEAMLALMKNLEAAGITVRDMGSGLTGISKDVATASEESILGLAAGINTQNFYISQVPAKLDVIISLMRGGSAVVDKGVNVQDLITLQNQFLSSLPSIAQNTADTVARCERAAIACERMASQLDRVIQPRGTKATHTVNIS